MVSESKVAPVSRRAFLTVAATSVGASLAAPATARGEVARSSDSIAAFELDEATIADCNAYGERALHVSQAVRGILRSHGRDRRAADRRCARCFRANPDALAIADSLDASARRGGRAVRCTASPCSIKDNIDTADRMDDDGRFARARELTSPPRDAFVVERLRAAGAVILGKTNLSEWANFRSTHSSSGWSGRGGQTRNPYALDRTPSGSSSGSAARRRGESLRGRRRHRDRRLDQSPSAAASLVGIKPTVGLVSRAGIIPISHTQDTAGPMARTVTDAAILLGALAGVDARDADDARERRAFDVGDYTKFLDATGCRARASASRASASSVTAPQMRHAHRDRDRAR